MDLRPKLAREFAEAIYDNMICRGLSDAPDVRDPIIEEWVGLIMDLFVSHSIPFPNNKWVCTDDEDVARQFIAKYPRIQELIDLAQAEALRRWPEATFTLETHSDPESGHITWEGQSLTMAIQTGLEFYGPNGEEYPENSPYYAAHDEWMDWTIDDDSPYWKLHLDIGEAAHLFRTDLKWKLDPEEE